MGIQATSRVESGRLLSAALRAVSRRVWKRIDRRRSRPRRAPRAGIPRRIADRVRPYLSTRVASYRAMTMPDSLRAEVPSCVFFILVIGTTFIL